ncbi:MAG TPA: haloalkane dehalogenase [Gammaproteobacteria bacterium]|nr:haloalkane dehalogenase [Gammaproteobacteria bacterium]
MQASRTPDERFQDLDNFPYQPNYHEIDDGEGGKLRMHYVDEGPKDAPIIFCVHGQPTWSYSFRKMIPPLTAAGYRVIAPDIVGFGRSDKPTQRSDYTFARHVQWMHDFVRGMNLNNITLVAQDWGGPITLRIVAADPDRFARVVVTNTGLADARGIPDEMAAKLRQLLDDTPVLNTQETNAAMREDLMERGSFQEQTQNASNDKDPTPPFMYWIKHCDASDDFNPGAMMSLWLNSCSAEEQRAYAAPFPAEEYLQGARQFPSLIPLSPDDVEVPANRKAWEALRTFDKPFLTAFTDGDPGSTDIQFQEEVPGAKGQKHVTIKDAMHYTQEDQGEEFARVVIEFIKANP